MPSTGRWRSRRPKPGPCRLRFRSRAVSFPRGQAPSSLLHRPGITATETEMGGTGRFGAGFLKKTNPATRAAARTPTAAQTQTSQCRRVVMERIPRCGALWRRRIVTRYCGRAASGFEARRCSFQSRSAPHCAAAESSVPTGVIPRSGLRKHRAPAIQIPVFVPSTDRASGFGHPHSSNTVVRLPVPSGRVQWANACAQGEAGLL